MITRRNFLKAGAAVAALSVVPNGFASILAKKEKAIGVPVSYTHLRAHET